MAKHTNLRPEQTDSIQWNGSNPAQALHDLQKAVELEVQKVIDWYWDNKSWKSFFSQWFQALALVLTAGAGLVPIIVQILKNSNLLPATYDAGPWASLFVGIAAALLGLDKAFGFSTGWIRYVVTATTMTKQLHEFRMDWVLSTAALAKLPVAEQQTTLIKKAKEFLSLIQGTLLQETKDWAAEFQANVAQLEKDLKTQLDSLKAQIDQANAEKDTAKTAGAIELTVSNADKTDHFTFDVELEGDAGSFQENVSGANVWTRINAAPGQYRLLVTATAQGKSVGTSTVVHVKPGETEKPSVSLPIS